MMHTLCNIMEKVLNSKAGVFLINSEIKIQVICTSCIYLQLNCKTKRFILKTVGNILTAFSTAGRILYLLHEQMPCSIFPKFKHVQILVYAESLSTRNKVQKVTR